MPETGIFGTGATVGVIQRQFVLVGQLGFRQTPFEHDIPEVQSVAVWHVVPQ